MWKFAAILLLAATCVHAEEEPKPTKNGPSLVETALCYIAPQPYNCIKEQTGRMLDVFEQTLEDKRHELMVEADEAMKESDASRSLSEEEKKEKPSEVMGAVEKGLSAIANMMSGEVNELTNRESRSVKQTKDVNDFNDDEDDDMTLLDAFGKAEAEGNLSESRAKKVSGKQGYGGSSYGYGSGGKGKKGKKGKKGLMKILFLGAIVKSKVEMLLRVLSFHLQLKFFAIALATLMINLARFWVDLKKSPQKVVYVEHAQHQHHYDEHDDWGSSWKRQAATPTEYTQDNFAHRLAYNNAAYPQH